MRVGLIRASLNGTVGAMVGDEGFQFVCNTHPGAPTKSRSPIDRAGAGCFAIPTAGSDRSQPRGHDGLRVLLCPAPRADHHRGHSGGTTTPTQSWPVRG
jgi:hypothetical protein